MGYLNFAECWLPRDSDDSGIGFAFAATGDGQADWSFRYCTVLKCSGSTGIQHNANGLGTVAYRNFDANLAAGGRGCCLVIQEDLMCGIGFFRTATEKYLTAQEILSLC
jgi:hypothetical protein